MPSPVLKGSWGAFSGNNQTSYTSTLGVSVAGSYFHVLLITYEMINSTANTISSVVAAGTSALTWTRKYRQTYVGGQGTPAFSATEVWVANGHINTGSGDEVTVTFGAAVDHGACAGASFSGVNATPFDGNASLPGVATVTDPSAALSVNISTTNADDYLLAACSTADNTTIGTVIFGGVNNDFNQLNDNSGGGVNFCRATLAGLQVSSTQSGIAVGPGGTVTDSQMIVFALTADNAPPAPPSAQSMVLM